MVQAFGNEGNGGGNTQSCISISFSEAKISSR